MRSPRSKHTSANRRDPGRNTSALRVRMSSLSHAPVQGLRATRLVGPRSRAAPSRSPPVRNLGAASPGRVRENGCSCWAGRGTTKQNTQEKKTRRLRIASSLCSKTNPIIRQKPKTGQTGDYSGQRAASGKLEVPLKLADFRRMTDCGPYSDSGLC